MSDTANSEPADDTAQAGAQAPSVRILAQYLKDLSFESPQAPGSLQQRDNTPPININVNVGARALADQDFEVTLTMEARAGGEAQTLFQVELEYAGVFRIGGIKREHLQPYLLIEGPRLLFPFARQIVSDAVRNGGFAPLMIDPIDFVALYRQNMARLQTAQQRDGGSAGAQAIN